MNLVPKIRLIMIAVLLLVLFVPLKWSPAAIFEGTETEEGVHLGLCLEADAAQKYPAECAGVNCSDPKNDEEIIKCTSEAEAGTELAKTKLSSTGITHTENLGDYIKKLVNFVLPYLTLAAFVGYVAAGFMYVTAFGNEQMLEKSKKILIWSTIGLILVILSYAITNLLTGELIRGLAG